MGRFPPRPNSGVPEAPGARDGTADEECHAAYCVVRVEPRLPRPQRRTRDNQTILCGRARQEHMVYPSGKASRPRWVIRKRAFLSVNSNSR